MLLHQTPRLVLRPLTTGDADVIRELFNDASFLRFVGDRGVRTSEQARLYIESGPLASYACRGFGLNLVELKATGEAVGICGLLQRDELPAPDLGFALLPRFRSQGYAFEAAEAVLAHARHTLGLERVLAITSPDNAASIKILERLGFRFDRLVRLSAAGADLKLFQLT